MEPLVVYFEGYILGSFNLHDEIFDDRLIYPYCRLFITTLR